MTAIEVRTLEINQAEGKWSKPLDFGFYPHNIDFVGSHWALGLSAILAVAFTNLG